MAIRAKLWASVAIVAGLCGVLLLAPVRSAARPQTDRAAVMAILDQRRIAYADVQVHGAESGVPQDHLPYVAVVVVKAERPAYGKIECGAIADDCVLWIESLGVQQVALPPRAATSFWGRIKERLDTVVVPLRAWLAGIGQH
jgi:hypothetical protein